MKSKKYLCGFYGEPLKWTIYAQSSQEAAKKFVERKKRLNLVSKSGTTEFVVFKAREADR